MGSINTAELLVAGDPNEPCGPDLKYDLEFQNLERAAQVKPEQQIGDQVIPAQQPDWKEVRSSAISLLNRSKDVRLATYLTKSLLSLDGFPGFRDGLSVIHDLLAQYWDSVHPQLTQDGDYDPDFRMLAAQELTDEPTILAGLRSAPLAMSKMFGLVSIRDFRLAEGKIAKANDEETVRDVTALSAAFSDMPLETLQEINQAIADSITLVKNIIALFTEKVGANYAPDLKPVSALLTEAKQYLAPQVERLVGVEEVAGDASAEGEGGGTAATAQRALTGEIRSRADVIRAFDKIIQYYAEHEPASPIPMLVERAKRLIDKNFLDILRDMAPDGLDQARVVTGVQEEGS